MPSSHLPRTPCDKFVYDFPCDFLGIVDGYRLRHVCSHCLRLLRASCIFFYGASGATRTETVQRLYGNRAMSVQLPSSLRSLRTEIVWSPCGDRPSHGARAGIVQCHLRHNYGLRSYDFSKFVKLLATPNHRGRGARESVQKSHSRLLLAEAPRKGGYGQDMGSVDPSQAKCELGISLVYPPYHPGVHKSLGDEAPHEGELGLDLGHRRRLGIPAQGGGEQTVGAVDVLHSSLLAWHSKERI